MDKEKKIALLIDCDNVSHKSIDGVINELAKYGAVNIRRAYGDWKSPQLQGWEEKLHPFAITPIQQFAYTKGKNATDAKMIIEAMDLLYTQDLDAFALMTSDSDFTPLVSRILTGGLKVYGFGEKKTPTPFIDSCSQFIFIEKLIEVEVSESAPEDTDKTKTKKLHGSRLRKDAWLVKTLKKAVEQTVEDDGWSHLGQVGKYISNNTSFSPINYGYKKLGEIIKTIGLFNVEMRKNDSTMYVRIQKAERLNG